MSLIESWDPPYWPEPAVICESAGLSEESACSMILVVVPGDSALVYKLMDCSRLPDSVTGVNEIRMPGETLSPVLCETRRLVWLELRPTTFQPRLPASPI